MRTGMDLVAATELPMSSQSASTLQRSDSIFDSWLDALPRFRILSKEFEPEGSIRPVT